MRFTKLAVAVAGCLGVLACSDSTAVSPTAPPQDLRFTVGGPSCNVPSDYPTIQAAINTPGCSTVKVANGIYDEQVVIARDVILQGSGNGTILRPSSPTTLATLYTYPATTFWPGTVLGAVVLVQNSNFVRVLNLKIDGVNLTTLPAGASRVAGILYGESAGLIDNVTVTTMVVNGYSTRSYGIDLSAVGAARNVEVKNSRVTNWSRNAIQVQGASLTGNIHNNTLTGPGAANAAVPSAVPNGILFIHGAAGNATANTISALHTIATESRSGGIFFYDPLTAGIVVENNNIFDVDDAVSVSHNANGVIIRGNNLHANAEVGVQLEDGATDASITGNTITGNAKAGIRFGGASDPEGPPFADTPPGTGNVAHLNNISGNLYGVVNWDAKIFDATCNWWGSLSGPGPIALGTGDRVTTNVTYTPWIANAACGSSTATQKPCEMAYDQKAKDFAAQQAAARQTFDAQQRAAKAVFYSTPHTDAERKTFESQQRTEKNTFEAQQKSDKSAFTTQNSADKLQCSA